MSWVSRGRPRTEAATPPMIAPGTAAESSQVDTAPSAWTSGAGGSSRPPSDLRVAKRGPSERHPPRPHRVVLLVQRLGPSHHAGGLHQAGQLMQLGFHRCGPELFVESLAGDCPALPVSGGGLPGNRLVGRDHGRHCIEEGNRSRRALRVMRGVRDRTRELHGAWLSDIRISHVPIAEPQPSPPTWNHGRFSRSRSTRTSMSWASRGSTVTTCTFEFGDRSATRSGTRGAPAERIRRRARTPPCGTPRFGSSARTRVRWR